MTKQRKQKDRNQLFCALTNVFLVFLLGIYPLFQTGSYHTLLQVKTGFLYLVFFFFYGVFVIVGAYQLLHRSSKIEGNTIAKTWLVTDCAVLGFLLTSLLSWLVNDHKKEMFWGGYGRNVGLLVIVACGVIYFICSRFGELSQGTLLVMMFSMMFVVLIEVFNHLGVDLLHMYTTMDDRATMLSTLGNLTVLTTYLSLVQPVAVGLVLVSEEVLSKWFYGVVSFVGFLGMFATGTDSVYLVMTVLLLLSLVLAKENEHGRKWCILLIEVLVAGLFLRLLRWGACETTMKLESVLTSFVFEGHVMLLIMLVLLLVAVALLLYLNKMGNWKIVRKGMLISCMAGMAGVLIVILVLNFTLDEATVKETFGGLGSYLYFDDSWGTKRTQIWGLGMTAFARMSFWEKVVGYGPAGFYFALQEYLIETDMANITVSGVLVDAHSVYLQLLICQGMLGLACYLLAFVSGLGKCEFTSKENTQVVIYILWIASFLVQAMVNNIHIYTEPICFAMLGVWMRGLHSREEE